MCSASKDMIGTVDHPVTTLTLTTVSELLGEPQHRLIYLCEKGVVRPDHGDAKGRGSSRGFSKRNMLEFAVALRLRDVLLPVAVIAAVVRVLRVFEKQVAAQMPAFALPDSLQDRRAPDLRVVLSEGRLFFNLRRKGGKPKVFGGIDVRRLPRRDSSLELAEVKPLNGEGAARVELSITGVAQGLPKEVDDSTTR